MALSLCTALPSLLLRSFKKIQISLLIRLWRLLPDVLTPRWTANPQRSHVFESVDYYIRRASIFNFFVRFYGNWPRSRSILLGSLGKLYIRDRLVNALQMEV